MVPSPVALKLGAPQKLNQGETTEVAATIEKRFGFDDRVDVTVEMPRGVTGISAKPLKIEKGKSDGKLELSLAAGATPGTHVLKVHTKLKFNNVNIDTTDELTLTIDKNKRQVSKRRIYPPACGRVGRGSGRGGFCATYSDVVLTGHIALSELTARLSQRESEVMF